MTTTSAMSRRTFLRAASAVAGGAAGATALAGCGQGVGSGGPVPLAYWNFFTGGDGERMVGLVEAYRDEAPGVDVTDTTLMWGAPYYTKLAMACAGGRAPDLATLHASGSPPSAPSWSTSGTSASSRRGGSRPTSSPSGCSSG